MIFTAIHLQGLLAHAIKFLKLPGAIIFFIVTKISKSRRAKKKAYSQQFFSYGKVIPYTTLIFLLGVTFATIQPFMPLFALMYFVVNYFYVRFDLLYAMREPYQTGGMFWPVVRAPAANAVLLCTSACLLRRRRCSTA